MAQLNDISVYKGEAVLLTFTMTPATDISGWSISFTLKTNQTDSTALISQAAVLTTPASGVFTVTLTHAQTNRTAATYYYDVQRTDSGSEAVLSIGTFTISQEVLYP